MAAAGPYLHERDKDGIDPWSERKELSPELAQVPVNVISFIGRARDVWDLWLYRLPSRVQTIVRQLQQSKACLLKPNGNRERLTLKMDPDTHKYQWITPFAVYTSKEIENLPVFVKRDVVSAQDAGSVPHMTRINAHYILNHSSFWKDHKRVMCMWRGLYAPAPAYFWIAPADEATRDTATPDSPVAVMGSRHRYGEESLTSLLKKDTAFFVVSSAVDGMKVPLRPDASAETIEKRRLLSPENRGELYTHFGRMTKEERDAWDATPSYTRFQVSGGVIGHHLAA